MQWVKNELQCSGIPIGERSYVLPCVCFEEISWDVEGVTATLFASCRSLSQIQETTYNDVCAYTWHIDGLAYCMAIKDEFIRNSIQPEFNFFPFYYACACRSLLLGRSPESFKTRTSVKDTALRNKFKSAGLRPSNMQASFHTPFSVANSSVFFHRCGTYRFSMCQRYISGMCMRCADFMRSGAE